MFCFIPIMVHPEVYQVLEVSSIEPTVKQSRCDFRPNGLFLYSYISSEYNRIDLDGKYGMTNCFNGYCYTQLDSGYSFVWFVKNGKNIIGFKISVQNAYEPNFFIIYGSNLDNQY